MLLPGLIFLGPKNDDKNNKARRFNPLKFMQINGNEVYCTLRRFPLAILMFVALAGIIIYRLEAPYEKLRLLDEILNRIMAVLALGISFSLSVQVIKEKLGKNYYWLMVLGIHIVEVAILVMYYIFLFPQMDMVPVIRLLLITFSLLLSFLFIPYFLDKENFEIYFTKVITRLIVSTIYTVVLALGLIATLFAIKSLLYNNLNNHYYLYTWILGGFVFGPIHFLTGFPQANDEFHLEDYNKVLKVLLFYIIIPIVSIYTAVLYIYFAKIMITHIWPKGIVSYLVLSYSAIGIMTVFLISPFRQQGQLARLFTSLFPKLIFPLLAMMFVSISIRINEFGFTENRYLILIAGIWATLAMLFMNFNKGKKNILLFISLAIIALLSVVGPLSAFSISKMSQTHRFSTILEKYERIQNGKVVNNNMSVDRDDQKEISAILRYFNSSHHLTDLKYLPEDFSMGKIKEVFGFEFNNDIYQQAEKTNFSYSSYDKDPMIISGFNILFRFEAHRNDTAEIIFTKEVDSDYGTMKVNITNKNVLEVLRNNNELYRVDLMNHWETVYGKYGNQTIPKEEMTLVAGNDQVEVMVVFHNLNGFKEVETGKFRFSNIQGDLLIRVK